MEKHSVKATKRLDSELNDLIKFICLKPRMYVGSENFKMVASFIDGFAYAKDFDVIRNFSHWIGIKFKLPRNVAWFDNLEKKFSNDEEILEELPKLFEEFINNQKDKSKYIDKK